MRIGRHGGRAQPTVAVDACRAGVKAQSRRPAPAAPQRPWRSEYRCRPGCPAHGAKPAASRRVMGYASPSLSRKSPTDSPATARRTTRSTVPGAMPSSAALASSTSTFRSVRVARDGLLTSRVPGTWRDHLLQLRRDTPHALDLGAAHADRDRRIQRWAVLHRLHQNLAAWIGVESGAPLIQHPGVRSGS